MKRILSAILAITVMVSMTTGFVQAAGAVAAAATIETPVPKVISTKGKIAEIGDNRIRVAGKGSYNEIVLHIQEGTYIVDAEDGTHIPFTDLKTGDAVTAYYSPVVTRSIPPQSSAIALVVGTPETGNPGQYMKVAAVEQRPDGSVRVLCTNSERLVTIYPEIFAQPAAIKVGSELIVWYDIMTMSMPAQAGATKAVLLPVNADIRVHTGAGTIVIDKKELALGENDILKTNANTIMLPLRVIAESLGYTVVWNGEARTVELQNGMGTMSTVTIGSNNYGRLKMAVQLDTAPEIVNGTTLVPVEFFTDVLNLTVDINDSHI
ncbi:copper amine oxidase N-terminal domain-containing protein [Sporomusa paucivorans]|uniref:copper amine oxidase N-terminal domain-containing protein n=1 Tax=Sporomusa paucivorans TaxID=2376 RepID=UPI0035711F4B